MMRIFGCFLIICLLTSCAPAVAGPEPEVISHAYSVTDAAILNPERGFFTPYELPGLAGFSPVRTTGNTLVHLNIRLDDWRETDIPQEVLDGLEQNFVDIRAAGLKAIIRVAYNQGPFPDSEPDASKARILGHITQLQSLLRKNGDVIAWAEAGFIGAWGEWHTSTNGLDNLADKREILNALLAALPENRMAQVRYPANIIEMYPNPTDAVSARVAHHNDCFLSSATDVGTYERDGVNTIARDQAYLAELTRFTPMSGETCAPNPPRSECASAIREMELLHFSAINEAYYKGILRSWQQGGCKAEIENRLGYRLALSSAGFNEQVRPGGLLNLTVNLTNTGFAGLMNPRPVFVVMQSAAPAESKSTFLVRLDQGQSAGLAKSWQPGSSRFSLKLRLPETIAPGRYNLALWLPDEAETLQDNPLYAVRFANETVWDEQTGYNMLGQVTVSASATGSFKSGDVLVVDELTSSAAVPLPTASPVPTASPEPTTTPQSGSLITGLQVSNDAESISIQFAFPGKPQDYNAFQVFLDTDQSAATGFSISGLGADFLLENGTLNSYAGKGSDWSWTPPASASVTYLNASQLTQWRVLRADLGKPAAFELAAQLVDTGWSTVFLSAKTGYILK